MVTSVYDPPSDCVMITGLGSDPVPIGMAVTSTSRVRYLFHSARLPVAAPPDTSVETGVLSPSSA
jgi:hypothetical protein